MSQTIQNLSNIQKKKDPNISNFAFPTNIPPNGKKYKHKEMKEKKSTENPILILILTLQITTMKKKLNKKSYFC